MAISTNIMNVDRVKDTIRLHHYPTYRGDQLVSALKRGAGEWAEVKGWPTQLIELVSQQHSFVSFSASRVLTSVDGTKKAALTLLDGNSVETVLMQPKPGIVSVCVSCEVGCPMGCAFCATGKMGFKRVLTPEEITDQWLFWKKYALSHHIASPSHLVFMGMGEPLHNEKNVFQAIQNLHAYYGLGWRKISLSTCGIVPGIQHIANHYPQVNVALSLHAGRQEIRENLMPIAHAYSLSQLQQALLKYFRITKRQVMCEYIVLAGVNDDQKDLNALITWLKPLPAALIHVNLIRFNPSGTTFLKPSREGVLAWKRALIHAGVSVTIRKNLGTDIFGACGQLATQSLKHSYS